jgi:hypothetical protein
MDSSVQEAEAKALEIRRQLELDWARLWLTRLDDKTVAEGISTDEFERLFVESGEIIFATRDFKPLSFKEILNRNLGQDLADRVDTSSSVGGGWRKFVREHVSQLKPVQKRERPRIEGDPTQQRRKNGRGWLNQAGFLKRVR